MKKRMICLVAAAHMLLLKAEAIEVRSSVTFNHYGDVISRTHGSLNGSDNAVRVDISRNNRTGAMTGITDTLTGQVLSSDLQYDAASRVTTAHYQDSAKTAKQTFDSMGRLRHRGLWQGTNLRQRSEEFQFDQWGSVSSFKETRLGTMTVHNYGYDKQNRLTCVNYGSTQADCRSMSYQYDDFGNLTHRDELRRGATAIDGESYSYSGSDNPFRNDEWSHDVAGRVKSDGKYDYHYDRLGRQTLVTDAISGQVIVHALYDTRGYRARQFEGDVTRGFLRTDEGIVLREIQFDADELVTADTVEIDLPLDSRVSLDIDAGDLVHTTFHYTDRLGSAAVSESDDNWDSVVYSPYGLQFNASGDNHQGSYGYTGHEDDAHGAIYMRARYQFPSAARFSKPDPARDLNFARPGTVNLFNYVSNNPINAIDPTGLVDEETDAGHQCDHRGTCTEPVQNTAEEQLQAQKNHGMGRQGRADWHNLYLISFNVNVRHYSSGGEAGMRNQDLSDEAVISKKGKVNINEIAGVAKDLGGVKVKTGAIIVESLFGNGSDEQAAARQSGDYEINIESTFKDPAPAQKPITHKVNHSFLIRHEIDTSEQSVFHVINGNNSRILSVNHTTAESAARNAVKSLTKEEKK